MSEQLITIIYEKLKNFHDPISNKALDRNNLALNIACKDGHANISLNINPKNESKYNNLSIDLNNTLKEIDSNKLKNMKFEGSIISKEEIMVFWY